MKEKEEFIFNYILQKSNVLGIISTNQTEIATELNLSRRTVAKYLNILIKKGKIQKNKQNLTLVNPEQYLELSEYFSSNIIKIYNAIKNEFHQDGFHFYALIFIDKLNKQTKIPILELIKGINLLSKCGFIEGAVRDQGFLCLAIYDMPLKPLKLTDDLENLYLQEKNTKGSKGEQHIAHLLEYNKIKYEREKTFEDCINPESGYKLRYDFYLPDYNILIEYDGKQHFEPILYWDKTPDAFEKRKYHDQLKEDYAEKNNIKLIRIPYWELKEWHILNFKMSLGI